MGAAGGVVSGVLGRVVPQEPLRVFQAPGIVDDFYSSPLDWGKNNLLALALAEKVFLWNGTSGAVEELAMQLPDNVVVSSVRWAEGSHLSVGTSDGIVRVFDAAVGKQLRKMNWAAPVGFEGTQMGAVNAMAWQQHTLSSAGSGAVLMHSDVRQKSHQIASCCDAHEQVICGLEWNASGTSLASGSNDNSVCVYSASNLNTVQRRMMLHNSAVKALAWCPWADSVLATGGGTADRCIKLTDTTDGSCLANYQADSQVCSLRFSPNHREIMAAHGYSSNEVALYSLGNMSATSKGVSVTKAASLTGHTARVLSLSLSPDASVLASLSSDESLRFWRISNPTASTTPAAATASKKMDGAQVCKLR